MGQGQMNQMNQMGQMGQMGQMNQMQQMHMQPNFQSGLRLLLRKDLFRCGQTAGGTRFWMSEGRVIRGPARSPA